MTPSQHIEASRDRHDLEWLARRLGDHARRCRERGEATAASALERQARSLRREAERPVPDVVRPFALRPRPEAPTVEPVRAHEQQRRASARSPWRGRAVLPAKGHGGGR